jgi:hypothetical protein
MAGRIEPTPIRTDVATLGDYRSRALLGDQTGAFGHGTDSGEQAEEQAPSPAPAEVQPASPPTPAAPSGTPFEAAIAAGRIDAPAPLSQQLLMQRKGSWSPPDSDLHLTDRTA